MRDGGYPENVIALARRAAEKYPEDVAAAVALLCKEVKKLPEFPALQETFFVQAMQELVYNCRHSANRVIRREAGVYGGPAKVVVGRSEAVNRAAQTVFEYSIAGRSLGSLLGEELNDIAAGERDRAEGHMFNAKLCTKLASLVGEGQRVDEALTEAKLSRIFTSLRRKCAVA